MAQSVYLNVIHGAVDHIHIMTPYLILDDEMLNSLKRAAKSGIDVRILLPHIPDKKTINLIGKSYYPELLEAGIHIYEYTPGFIHSKVMEADGNIAIAGTINLDFRSLYSITNAPASSSKTTSFRTLQKISGTLSPNLTASPCQITKKSIS